jgi:pimeloyl-ACP methyl ester carboxylesterase
MFDGFENFSVQTQSSPAVTIDGIKYGDPSSGLPPLLLLHGFPQTRHIWHRVAPKLIGKYAIIIPDLRGYGKSSKPSKVADYAKSVMAQDFVTLMSELGFDSFFVCAHDRGARVAHKLCIDHPDRVRKTILLDICPTLDMYKSTNFDFAKAYYHWYFFIQDEPLPETLISAAPRHFIKMFMGGLDIFDLACFAEYAKNFDDPECVRAMCHDYRAGATIDLDEAREDLKNGRLITCPLLVIWGKSGVIEKCFDGLKEWRAVTQEDVPVKGYSVDAGHYIPEQAPDEVVSAILDFLK